MIRAVTDRRELAAIDPLAPHDPFACRVLSLFDAYPPTLPFAGYWTQTRDDGAVTSAMARSGADLILCLTAASDLDEVASFVKMTGASRVLCGDFALDGGSHCQTGPVLMRQTPFGEQTAGAFVQPDLREAYRLLQACANAHFQPPAFEDFYVDVSHKLRHGCIRITGVMQDGGLAAMAMTVAESPTCAVIGAVACAPDHRRQGFGAMAVKRLANALISEGKRVFLQRAEHENAAFYDRLGFVPCGIWREYD